MKKSARPSPIPPLSLFYQKRTKKKTENKNKKNPSPPIPQTLRPTRQTQHAKTLRLHLNRDIEPLRNRIRAKGHPARRPQEHHGGRQAFGRLGAVVAPDLGHELDAPEDGADCAEDGGGGGDGRLGGHLGFLFIWGF